MSPAESQLIERARAVWPSDHHYITAEVRDPSPFVELLTLKLSSGADDFPDFIIAGNWIAIPVTTEMGKALITHPKPELVINGLLSQLLATRRKYK